MELRGETNMKKLLCTVLALGMAMSMAACGATSTAASSAAASSEAASSEAASSEATEAAAEESDLAYITEKGKMVIGYTVYAPMNYTNENGEFVGFDTDLAKAVCAEMGVEPEFVEINWDTKETELAAKSIDCIWNGLTLTPEREANMACTDPYVKNAQVVVMKKDAGYTGTADLVGKTLVAEAGSAG